MNRSLRVTLINHAYVVAENQKTLSHLAREVRLQAIVPARLREMGLGMRKLEAEEAHDAPILLKRSYFVKGQLLLKPFGPDLAEHRPDVIHVEYTPWSPITLQTVLLARRWAPHARIVLTMRKNTYLPKALPIERLKQMMRAWVSRRVTAYVAESEIAKQLCTEWLGIPPDNIYICLQLGVDLDWFRPIQRPDDGSPMVIGFVGELHPKKGILELVDAVEECVHRAVPVQLRLLGAGPLQTLLKERAANVSWLKVDEPVPHREVAQFLAGCDTFAMPCRNEPDHQEHDGHALMEAMACGLSAIVTRSGIIPELTDCDSALFVRENHRRDLVAAIEKLANDRDTRLRMGKRARQLAEERFGLGMLARRRRSIYEEVTGV